MYNWQNNPYILQMLQNNNKFNPQGGMLSTALQQQGRPVVGYPQMPQMPIGMPTQANVGFNPTIPSVMGYPDGINRPVPSGPVMPTLPANAQATLANFAGGYNGMPSMPTLPTQASPTAVSNVPQGTFTPVGVVNTPNQLPGFSRVPDYNVTMQQALNRAPILR